VGSLGDDWKRGTGVTVRTFGHGQGPLEPFLARLAEHGVELVLDVRSVPYANHAPHFSRPELEAALRGRGVRYEWVGELLGQRPSGDEFYDEEGHTLYEHVAAQKWFLKAIGQVEHLAGDAVVALVCVEEPPENCHRLGLLGRVLAERGARVLHVRRDGRVESQVDVEHRTGQTQDSLFEAAPRPWRSHVPMRGGHGVADRDDDVA